MQLYLYKKIRLHDILFTLRGWKCLSQMHYYRRIVYASIHVFSTLLSPWSRRMIESPTRSRHSEVSFTGWTCSFSYYYNYNALTLSSPVISSKLRRWITRRQQQQQHLDHRLIHTLHTIHWISSMPSSSIRDCCAVLPDWLSIHFLTWLSWKHLQLTHLLSADLAQGVHWLLVHHSGPLGSALSLHVHLRLSRVRTEGKQLWRSSHSLLVLCHRFHSIITCPTMSCAVFAPLCSTSRRSRQLGSWSLSLSTVGFAPVFHSNRPHSAHRRRRWWQWVCW